MADQLTADQLVAIVNQLGFTPNQVASVFAGAKATAEVGQIQAWIDAAIQADAALRAQEADSLAPYEKALSDASAAVSAVQSQRANALAAAKAAMGGVSAANILTDDQMKTIAASLQFGR